jgi:hypothetical protein
MKIIVDLFIQVLMIVLLVSCHHENIHAKSLVSAPIAIQIVDQYGQDLPTYQHRAKTYVMGEYGERYQIKVTNLYGNRIEAVVTVDGRDVINGQSGAFHHRGYVINAYQSVLIDGFRQSQDQVATFRFSSPSNSYSSKMGSPQNVGVIGVAVFEENQPPVVYYPTQTAKAPIEEQEEYAELDDGASGAEDDAPPTSQPSSVQGGGRGDSTHTELSAAPTRPSNRMAKMRRTESAKSNLGTQYGESRYSASQKTTFERRTEQPSTVVSLYYDNYAGLVAKGVIRSRQQVGGSAFPAEEGFAPPPP